MVPSVNFFFGKYFNVPRVRPRDSLHNKFRREPSRSEVGGVATVTVPKFSESCGYPPDLSLRAVPMA